MTCDCRSCAPSVDVVSPLLNDPVLLAKPKASPALPASLPRLPVENTGSASTP